MLDLMMELNQQIKTSLVIVTHDLNIAARMHHQWRMVEGLLNRET